MKSQYEMGGKVGWLKMSCVEGKACYSISASSMVGYGNRDFPEREGLMDASNILLEEGGYTHPPSIGEEDEAIGH